MVAVNVLAIPFIASAQESNVTNVTYQEDKPTNGVNYDFDFKTESAISSSLIAVEELKNYYNSIAHKDVLELTSDEIHQMTEHLNKTMNALNMLDDSSQSSLSSVQAKGYPDTSDLTKMIELMYNANLSGLTSVEIFEGAYASVPARKAGEAYAAERGWVTWDNPADALRHFSWNFIMGKKIGVASARIIADTHELALVTADMANSELPGLSNTEKAIRGAALINDVKYATRASYSTFNSTFDNSSIMDLNNNSAGRKYSLRSYGKDDYLKAFNDAYWIDIEWYDTGVGTNDREHAWNAWQ